MALTVQSHTITLQRGNLRGNVKYLGYFLWEQYSARLQFYEDSSFRIEEIFGEVSYIEEWGADVHYTVRGQRFSHAREYFTLERLLQDIQLAGVNIEYLSGPEGHIVG